MEEKAIITTESDVDLARIKEKIEDDFPDAKVEIALVIYSDKPGEVSEIGVSAMLSGAASYAAAYAKI